MGFGQVWWVMANDFGWKGLLKLCINFIWARGYGWRTLNDLPLNFFTKIFPTKKTITKNGHRGKNSLVGLVAWSGRRYHKELYRLLRGLDSLGHEVNKNGNHILFKIKNARKFKFEKQKGLNTFSPCMSFTKNQFPRGKVGKKVVVLWWWWFDGGGGFVYSGS